MLKSIVATVAIAALLASPALADKKKSGPAKQADLERLERKIDDQQKVIDRLVKLQQQYMQSLAALFDASLTASTPPPGEPKADEPKPAEPKLEAKIESKLEAKAPIDIKPAKFVDPRSRAIKKDGAGTIVGKVTGAADAIVYIEDIVAAPRAGTAAMKQEGKQFVPPVLVVQKGTTVQFPNLDAVFHNVFSVSPDNSFDLGSYRQGESRSVTMSRPGVISVYCNMHPQMVGHILVVPNGAFVRAGKDGFYRIPNVPAGRHRVVAWSPNAKSVTADAEVTDAQVVTVELELKQGRTPAHMKKDGLPYGSYDQ